MKKIYITLVVVVAIVIGWLYLGNSKKMTQTDDSYFENAKNKELPSSLEKTEGKMEKNEVVEKDTKVESETTSSKYMLFSTNVLAENKSPKKLLFFYASWCPTCRPVDSDIKANAASIPSDLTIFRVNYNDPDTDANEKELAKKYGITYQHTFVLIDTNGNELKKWNGGNFEEILSKIK